MTCGVGLLRFSIFIGALGANLLHRQLPGTTEAQAFINQWQNPRDCTAAKWLPMHGWTAGVGSELHVATAAMACTMNLGAIFVWEHQSAWLSDAAVFCGDKRTFDCVFLPVSNCTIGVNLLPQNRITGRCGYESEFAIPERFAQLDTAPFLRHYWWRAQASAYIMRFNARFELLIEETHNALTVGPARTAPAVSMCNCVCVHVRHGDKAREMRLRPWRDIVPLILSALETLSTRERSGACHHHALERAPSVFFTTDNSTLFPLALEQFGAQLSFVNDTSPDAQLEADGGTKKCFHNFVVAMLNVHLCSKCDAFVLQRSSNFARLIDEQRLTVGEMLGAPFIEIGEFTVDWRK